MEGRRCRDVICRRNESRVPWRGGSPGHKGERERERETGEMRAQEITQGKHVPKSIVWENERCGIISRDCILSPGKVNGIIAETSVMFWSQGC